MFTDPQTLTVNGVATTLPRTGSENPTRTGSFKTADGTFEFTVSQNKTANRFRREVRLTQKLVAPDPISAVNKEVSASCIIVIDEPRWGFTDVQLGHLSSALVAWFTAARRDQLLGGEL